MRGALLTCLVYASLPLVLLGVVKVIQSGFPLLPLATGAAIFCSNRKGR